MNTFNFLQSDFNLVSKEMPEVLAEFKNKKILITGATGFFGKWLLHYLVYLNQYHEDSFEVLCISRDSASFLRKFPFIAKQKFISWHDQNLNDGISVDFSADYIIHMATDVATHNSQQKESFDSIISGSQNVIDYANALGKQVKLILTSSGAVYGKQPSEVSHITEDSVGDLYLLPEYSYAKAKRLSEELCKANARSNSSFHYTVARCFAFSGAFLSLDGPFAIGNFVRDAIQGETLIIQGNGLALRSYMYGADLVAWLTKILISGKSGDIYNVGSDEAISIKKLAETVCTFFPDTKIIIKGARPENYLQDQYVPNISKAKNSLNLKLNYSNSEGIARMISIISHK